MCMYRCKIAACEPPSWLRRLDTLENKSIKGKRVRRR